MKRIICFILLVCNLVFFTSCASSCSLFHAYDIPEQVKSLYAEAEIDVADIFIPTPTNIFAENI